MNIGNKICILRKKHGYSQERLAKLLGISFQAISKWENGNSSPDIDLLTKISRIFNVSVDFLLDNNPIDEEIVYNNRYKNNDYFWGIEPNHSCYEIMKYLPPIKPYRVLDVGCGEGKDAVFFAKNGYNVTAFDITSKGIEKTKKLADANKVNVNTFVANINEFTPQEEYDIVFSSSVLHLVHKNIRVEFLNKLIANTKNGGIHMIQVHVKKPFIEKPPARDESIEVWKSGELFSLYSDHEILYCDEYVFDCNSGGIPHRHCANKIIARIIK